MDQLDYLDERPAYVPFSNAMHEDVYRLWVTYAYWEHLDLREVLSDAIVAYLKDKPSARRPLPPKKEASLGWKIHKARKS